MLRFIGLVVLLALSFGFGYLRGKQPTNNLEQTVRVFSRNMLDSTLGVERDLHRRQNLVDAKSRVVQAKAETYNKNAADAVKELAEAVNSLEIVMRGEKQADPQAPIKELAGRIRELRLEISLGKKVSLAKFEEIQKELDLLLRKYLPALNSGRLLLPLRKNALDPHLDHHISILQQWLDRFATTFIANGFQRRGSR